MTAHHTPGPWQARTGLSRWNVTTCEKPRTFNICAINTDRIEQAANAHLIAAAPELLAALQMMLAEYHEANVPLNWEGAAMASTAIAKARGEV